MIKYQVGSSLSSSSASTLSGKRPVSAGGGGRVTPAMRHADDQEFPACPRKRCRRFLVFCRRPVSALEAPRRPSLIENGRMDVDTRARISLRPDTDSVLLTGDAPPWFLALDLPVTVRNGDDHCRRLLSLSSVRCLHGKQRGYILPEPDGQHGELPLTYYDPHLPAVLDQVWSCHALSLPE
jgi:hypothetical protein